MSFESMESNRKISNLEKEIQRKHLMNLELQRNVEHLTKLVAQLEHDLAAAERYIRALEKKDSE